LSQNVALYLHERQFSPQPADLHLLGIDFGLAVSPLVFAFALRLDTVVKFRVGHAQHTVRRRNALATLEQSNRFLLTFEGVLKHLERDTLFGSKVTLAGIGCKKGGIDGAKGLMPWWPGLQQAKLSEVKARSDKWTKLSDSVFYRLALWAPTHDPIQTVQTDPTGSA
jgi:hypothetical protein